jgi:glutamate formiminotransferase/formiminotetrahydrofolate cyclodeaminase
MGALGISLATMVANLSSHKRGWESRWKEFSDWAEKGQAIKEQLLHAVDEDTLAFNRIMNAFALPKSSDDEKAQRTKAIQDATRIAIDVPFNVMKLCLQAMPIIKVMTETGNPNSISDAGTGAVATRSAALGAWLNVKINCAGLKDEAYKSNILMEAERIKKEIISMEKEILDIVEKELSK